MKIANIIYEAELVNHVKSDYINYYNEPKAYDEIDKLLPTLYVGWSFMKKCNPENPIIQNANILKKKIITNELYWELSFIEGKPSHVKGVNNFTSLAPEFYFKPKYDYIGLDPIFFQLKSIQDLMNAIPKKIDIIYTYKNETLYIKSDNKIFGIDLKLYKYFQFNIDEILEKLKKLTFDNNSEKHYYIDDVDGSYYQKYNKLFPNFEFLKRYIVTI